ncbi:hypothetical protein ACFVWY_22430 [Streptomyces sp. NPDC058195]|uniref:hypothetical protein n=1 Tax=Streptomyces sp. NPDC058195 TaxID=3346375 RepID=UPI0036EE53A9
MGIESDQLVYDYLSRVGDLAQQQQLSSADRMRLVATLRGEIDRQRGKAPGDSPAAVRRIIGRLGSPDELVAAAATPGDGAAESPVPREVPRPAVPRPRRSLLRKDAPGPAAAAEAPPEPAGDPGPLPPHRAGTDELGPSRGEPDWWRVEQVPFGRGVDVPGFTGGVEIAAMLRQPLLPAGPGAGTAEDGAEGEEAEGAAEEAEGTGEEDAPAKPRRRLPRLVRRTPRADRQGGGGGGFTHPLLLLAALLLVAGAATGSWLALAGGWLLTYSSRTLSRTEAKWAVMGLPGTVAAGALLWLWGRSDGRWGEPVAAGQLNAAIDETWPWALRGAAVATALYLVWRARRPRA